MTPTPKGFTLLELLITIAVISIILTLTTPNFDSWNLKKSFDNSHKELLSELSIIRNEALIRNVTSRLNLTRVGDDYTITTFISDVPTTNCSVVGATWTQLKTKALDLDDFFEITGSGVGDVCFFRDGLASGGTYTFAQKDAGTEVGFAQLIITVATGYVDVVE